jgi:YVTN family beta-propeller protein
MVSVIATATNTVTAKIPVGHGPLGVAFTPDGSKAYVANEFDGNVSVIATASHTVVGKIGVGAAPIALGTFIQPPKVLFHLIDAPPPANRREHR